MRVCPAYLDREHDAAVRVLWIGLGWLTIEYFIAGPYSYFRMHDSGNNNVALLLSLAADPNNAGYWYPAVAAGFDRLASGFFTGLDRILFALLPGWLPSQLICAAMVIGGGWATWRLCRERLALPRSGAIIAAFLHATMTVSQQMGLAAAGLLPFLLWSMGKALDRGPRLSSWIVVAAASLSVGLLTQAHILLPFAPVLVVLWFLFIEDRNITSWAMILFACALLFASQATVIVALAANAPLSFRAIALRGADSIEFSRLDLLSPATRFPSWISWILLLFAVTAVSRLAWQNSPRARRIGALLVTAYLLPWIGEAVKELVLPIVPILGGFRLERFAFYQHFFLAIAVGLATLAFPEGSRPVLRRNVFLSLVALILSFSLVFKYYHARQWLEDGNYVQNFESPVLKELARTMHADPTRYRAVSVNMHTNVLASYGIETVDGYVNIYSRRYREFWERVSMARVLREGPLGSPSEVRLFHNAELPVVDFAAFYSLDLLSLANVRYIVSRNELQHANLHLLRGPTGPWSQLPLRERLLERVRENFLGSSWIYVYENDLAMPRAFFNRRAPERFLDSSTLLSALSQRPVSQLRDQPLIVAEDAPDLSVPTVADIRAFRRMPDRIEIDVAAQTAGVLTVTENFSPYWRCLIDGAVCKPFPAYHTFLGILVPGGARQVTLIYDPPEKLF